MRNIIVLAILLMLTGCGGTVVQPSAADQQEAYMKILGNQKSDDIDQWPAQQKIDLTPFKARFKEAFASQPSTFAMPMPPLVECQLPEELKRILTNTKRETLMAPYETMETSGFSSDVYAGSFKADIFSTEAGCALLKSAQINDQIYPTLFRLPADFVDPVKMDIRYDLHSTTTMDINGDTHTSKAVTNITSKVLLHRPHMPADPSYSMEALVISGFGEGNISYNAAFKQPNLSNSGLDELHMLRNSVMGFAQNLLVLDERNDQGVRTVYTYNKDGLMATMVDGKLKMNEPSQIASSDMPSKDSSNEPKITEYQENQRQEHIKDLQAKAKCNLVNDKWAYTGDACMDGLAHGEGSAEDIKGLKFVGVFEAGLRIKGEIHHNGEMIFSGKLEDDKPSGDAICLHEGEYEECRFFRGKRIDSLYKMRKENAKLEEKIAAMQSQQQKSYQHASATQDSSMVDYAGDAIKKEGMKRTAEFLFDQLF